MGTYKAVYKCRLCGEVYQSGAETGEEMARAHMRELVVGIVGTVPMTVRRREIHHCGGEYAGSLGLAVFQGWKNEQ